MLAASAWAQEPPRRPTAYDAAAEAWRVGDPVTAVRDWEEAIRISRAEGDAATEVNALARRGEALTALGQTAEAAGDLRDALALAQRLAQPRTVAALEGALGHLAYLSHDLDQARDWLEQSVAAARAAGAVDILAETENNLGNVRAAGGAPGPAIDEWYAPAARDAGDDKPLRASIAINTARALLQLRFSRPAESGRLRAQADAKLSDAARLLDASPASRDQVVSLDAIARIGLSMRHTAARGFKAANPAFLERLSRRATALAGRMGSLREKSLTEGTLAEALLEANQTEEAETWDREAIRDAVSLGAKDLLWRWEWLNGRLARKAGDRRRALDAYRRARMTLQDIRMDLSITYSDEGVSSFREEVGPLYFESVDLLLAAADSEPGNAPDRKDLLGESVKVIEVFETAEVLNFFHRPCQKIPDALPRLPQRGGHQAILYPILRPDRIDLLVTLPDDTLVYRFAKIGQTQAEHVIQLFRDILQSGGDNNAPARQLYDWLMRPVADDLARQSVDTLVVVPDGVLRSIPFSALYDGASGQYLIEQMAVVTEPSADLASGREAAPPRSERLLLSGTSTYADRDAVPLPGVNDELAAIEKLKPDATLLQNADFTADALQEKLRGAPFTTVHIAAHAVFNGTPENSYILTAKGEFSLDMLEAAVKSTPSPDDQTALDLLILSACETASGNDQAALGLAGVAVKAGARNAIGSLWEVDDAVSAELMPGFYRNLEQPSVTKAQALQQIQIYMLRHTTYKNPNYWAPFLLIGDGS